MNRFAILIIPIALATAACSGDDTAETSDDSDATSDTVSETSPSTTEPETETAALPDGIPAECVLGADIEFEMSAVPSYSGTLALETSVGRATPITPNAEGSLDDVDMEGFRELGAATDLLFYTQWIGNHSFTHDDLGFLGGPEVPADAITLALTIVPTSVEPIKTGDQISSQDTPELNSITTFASVGLYLENPEGIDTWVFVDNFDEAQGGIVEILYLDDEWMCASWNLAGGTGDPDGTYSMSGVVTTPLDRAETPFT